MYIIYEIEAILWEHGDSVGQSFTSLHKFQQNYEVMSLVDYWFFKWSISMIPMSYWIIAAVRINVKFVQIIFCTPYTLNKHLTSVTSMISQLELGNVKEVG